MSNEQGGINNDNEYRIPSLLPHGSDESSLPVNGDTAIQQYSGRRKGGAGGGRCLLIFDSVYLAPLPLSHVRMDVDGMGMGRRQGSPLTTPNTSLQPRISHPIPSHPVGRSRRWTIPLRNGRGGPVCLGPMASKWAAGGYHLASSMSDGAGTWNLDMDMNMEMEMEMGCIVCGLVCGLVCGCM